MMDPVHAPATPASHRARACILCVQEQALTCVLPLHKHVLVARAQVGFRVHPQAFRYLGRMLLLFLKFKSIKASAQGCRAGPVSKIAGATWLKSRRLKQGVPYLLARLPPSRASGCCHFKSLYEIRPAHYLLELVKDLRGCARPCLSPGPSYCSTAIFRSL